MRRRRQRPSIGLLCWIGIGVTALGACAQRTKSADTHEPVVKKLIALLDEQSDLRDTLEQAIATAAIEDFDSLDGLYAFVDGLVTGWHDLDASHLALLEAVAGPTLVQAAYREAERADYLWHEFGDSCLLLP